MDPWSIAISAASLTISAILAFREFLARPVLLAWRGELSQSDGKEWLFRGHHLQLGNIGRRPLVLQAVGVKTGQESTRGVHGSFEYLGEARRNPDFPIVLQSGQFVTYIVPADQADKSEQEFQVEMVRRRLFGGLFGRRLVKSVWRPIPPGRRVEAIEP